MRLISLLLCLVAIATTGTAQENSTTGGFSFKTIAKGFHEPVGLATLPAEPAKLLVIEREGSVRVLENGKPSKHDLLDIEDILSPEENPGLSSIAFPSDYTQSKAFYVSYTDKQGDTIIGRFPSKESETADEDDLVVILKVVQPTPHHHRSYITFGPDGYLYLTLGDAPQKVGTASLAQNNQSLFGKVLRIDISNPQRYSIPKDNPFAQGKNGAPEVWASGFQQPSHLSFDPQTKHLFLIDSGLAVQEIDLVERGKNYGWSITEGSQCSTTECNASSLTRPLYAYRGNAVGGCVYSGELHRDLKDAYLFADTPSKTLRKLTNSGGEWKTSTVATALAPIVAVNQGSSGEIYVAFQDGTIASVAQQRP